MSAWTSDQLELIAGTDEIGVSSRRPDGTLRPFITIWAVTAGDGVFVRSAHGAGNGWYRRALASGSGRIRVAGHEFDVTFSPAPAADGALVDGAYAQQYGRYPTIVPVVVGPATYDITLRLDPTN